MLVKRLIDGPFSALIPARLRAQRHRAVADGARDTKDWLLAAAEYGKSLSLSPLQLPIWIQLGHARKELGDLSGSEAAYRKALEISPRDSDGALQLGHVLKIQGRRDEALDWYTKAIVFDPNNRNAAHELIGLGKDPASIVRKGALSTAAARPKWRFPDKDVSIFMDITDAWVANERGAEMDRAVLWFLELGFALRQASPRFFFVVRAAGASRFSRLTDNAVVWLRTCTRAPKGQTAGPAGALAPISDGESRLLVLSTPPDKADVERWTASICRLRENRQVSVVAVLPRFDMLHHRALYLKHEIEDAYRSVVPLLEQAAVVLTTSSDDGDCAVSISRELGREMRAIILEGSTKSLAKPHPAARDGSKLAVLASRDPHELIRILNAWKDAAVPETLSLIAPSTEPSSIRKLEELVLRECLSRSDFEVVPPDVVRVRELLRGAKSLLVPDSRQDGIFWIEDALRLGVPVIAGQSSAIFGCWGGAISDYCDFRQTDQLRSRWLTSATGRGNAWCELSMEQWSPWTEKAVKVLSDLRASPLFEVSAGVAIVNCGVFYSLSSDLSFQQEVQNGRNLLVGSNWRESTREGVVVDKVGHLQFLIDDFLDDRFCYVCLVSGSPGTSIVATVESLEQQSLSESNWSVPDSGWGWLSGEFNRMATSPRKAITKLSMTVQPTEPVTAAASRVTIGGLFLYPRNMDRCWFEFLDRASHDALPFPIRFRSQTISSIMNASPTPIAGQGQEDGR